MSILDEIIRLLCGSSGNLIYQTGLILALVIALVIVLGDDQKSIRRIAYAAGVVLLTRLGLLLILVLEIQGLFSQAIFPSLERATDALGTWLLIWSIMPMFDRPRWSKLFAASVSLSILFLCLVFTIDWHTDAIGSSAAYNGSAQETVWEVIQLALLGTAGVHLLLDRKRDWMLLFTTSLILFAAHAIQFGWAVPGESIAVWERVGQLLAYPLFTLCVHRKVVGGMVYPLAPAPHATLSEQVERIRLLGAVMGTHDENLIVQATLDAIAHLTGAESVSYFQVREEELAVKQPAVALQTPVITSRRGYKPDATGLQELAAIAPLKQALEKRETILLVPGDKNNVHRLALLAYLSQGKIKTDKYSWIMLQPVYKEDEILGLLLIQSPDDPSWAAANSDTVDLLTTQLINGLTLVRYRQLLRDQTARIDRLRQGAAQSQKMASKLDALTDHQRTKIESLEEKITRIEAIRDYRVFADRKEKGLTEKAILQRPVVEYIAHVAQELRRPVASILGYSELLLGGSGGKLGELQQLYLERIKAGSERVVLLIEDLLSIVSPEWAPFLVNLKPVNVVRLIEETIGDFSEQLDLRGIELRSIIDHTLPRLELDPDNIRQIVFYLFSNALQASPANRKVVMEVSYQPDTYAPKDTKKQRGYLFITVSDVGAVVALDKEKLISGETVRAERPMLESKGGVAVTLSHVKDLVQVHGGRIWVESEPDVSNTLRLVLPASVAA
ncbi:MAG: HAMP domain-containing histidine kinase [Anaerolineales bacterium]|nr:HAMP domain-containing histidine kinase [Anaerolineales bacterium]